MPPGPRWNRLFPSPWTETVVFGILLVSGLVVRLWQIQNESVWYDEHFLYHNLLGHRNLVDFFTELRRTDPPITPVYFTIQYYWTKLVGVGILQLRLASVLFSLAAALMLYALVRKMYGPVAALTALFLACFSNFHIYYGQEIRPYALLLLLSVTSMYGFYRACHEGGRRWQALHYGATFLLLFTHLFGAFLLAAQGVYLLMLHGRRPWRVLPWVLGHLPAVSLLAWWISTMNHEALATATITTYAYRFFSVFVRCITWDGAYLPHAIFQGELGLIAALLAIAGLGWWSFRRAESRPTSSTMAATPWQKYLLLCCWLLLPPLLLLLYSYARTSVFNTRYMLYSSFALFAMFAAGLSVIRPPRVRAIALATTVGLLLWHCLSEYRPFRPTDYASMAWITRNKGEADRIMYSPPVGLPVLPRLFPEYTIESGHVDIVPPWVDVATGETLWVIYSRPGWSPELAGHEATLKARGLRYERVQLTESSCTFVYTSLCLNRLDPYFTAVYRVWRDGPSS